MTITTLDPVNRPAHYRSSSGIECIEVIEVYGLMHSFHLGNAVKYLWRAGSKDALLTDLEKARWYIARWEEVDGSHPAPDGDIPDHMTPDAVIVALGLSSYRADLLHMILTDLLEDDDTSDVWLDTLDAAIVEAGGTPKVTGTDSEASHVSA